VLSLAVDPPVEGSPAQRPRPQQLFLPLVLAYLIVVAATPARRCRARRRHWVKREQLPITFPTRRRQRSRRRKSLGNEPLTRAERELSKELRISRLPVLPANYGECLARPRPCYFFRCTHNLYLDVNAESGSIVLNFPNKEPHELEHTCALDVALEGAEPGSDRGEGHTLERVGELLNVGLEWTRQLEESALHSAEIAVLRMNRGPRIDAAEKVARLEREAEARAKKNAAVAAWKRAHRSKTGGPGSK
jgi:hypothetical protein